MKEKLGGHEEKMKEDEEAAAALRSDIAERDNALEAKAVEIAKLKALIAGSSPVASDGDDEYIPSKSNRAKVIAEYAKDNGISEFSATLRLGKERPELFNN